MRRSHADQFIRRPGRLAKAGARLAEGKGNGTDINDMTSPCKVAAVQAAPAYMDLKGTVEKTVSLIEKAAEEGAALIVFPETWIPGYPFWAWLGAPAWGMQFVQAYSQNSLEINSSEYRVICEAAAENNIHVMLGFSERYNNTLYIAQALIGPDGKTVFTRRKLKPTHVERSIFGNGDGSDFQVADTPMGRVGALCCWEHIQPLSKYIMFNDNEQIHCASWPAFGLYDGVAYALGHEINMRASQVYALEGQCFVIASCALVTKDIVDRLCETDEQRALLSTGGGHSKIFAPDGSQISVDLAPDEEGLVCADIDLSLIPLAKAAADPAGHYSRPDVVQLFVDRTRRRPVVEKLLSEGEPAKAPSAEPGDANSSIAAE